MSSISALPVTLLCWDDLKPPRFFLCGGGIWWSLVSDLHGGLSPAGMCQATVTTARVPVLMVSEQVDANVGLLPSRDGGEAL